MRRPAPATVDVACYAGSAIFAACAAHSTLLSIRLWGDLAWPVYTGGAAAAALIRARHTRLKAAFQLRAAVAALVLGGVALVPLAVAVSLRAERGPRYVQSEVLVVEQAAGAVLHGRDPYASTFNADGLSHRGYSVSNHFPYFPLMLAFGLPRALLPRVAWADARVFFAAATLAFTGVALARSPVRPDTRLRILQVSLVLPTGALGLVVSGDDVLVLSLLLLALVSLHSGARAGHRTLAAAMLLKATAWPLLLAVFAHRSCPHPRGRGRPVVYGLVPVVLLLAWLWQPLRFVEATVLYPLGLGRSPSPAHAPTVGSLVMATIAGHTPQLFGRLLAGVLVGFAVFVGTRVLVSWPRNCMCTAASGAAAFMAAFLVLTPVSRPGYWAYPVDLFAWGLLLARDHTRRACLTQSYASGGHGD